MSIRVRGMIIFRLREKSGRIDREDEMGYFNEEGNEKDRKSERRTRREDYKIEIREIEGDENRSGMGEIRGNG